MNLILLDSLACRQFFPAGTLVANHLRDVLKVKIGDTFLCGVPNAQRGQATISAISETGTIEFSVDWENKISDETLPPARLLVGLSRPQTMKKIFSLAGEIGCEAIEVFPTERGDPAYAKSTLWRAGNTEIDAILKKSAEQACSTFFPSVRLHQSLDAACDCAAGTRILLDVYAKESFAQIALPNAGTFAGTLTLAIGSERGWTERERAVFAARGFVPAHLGTRVLRVENAVAVALGIAQAKRAVRIKN